MILFAAAPATFAQTVMDEFLAVVASFAQEIGAAIAVTLIILLLYRAAVHALRSMESNGRLSKPLVFITRRGVRWIAAIGLVVAIMHCFGVLEYAWAAITTVLAMIAIGFVAVWSVLSNTLCSVMLILTRPFQVGDTIEVSGPGLRGKVVNFTMLFTTLRADEGDLIRVPNNLFFQQPIRCAVSADAVPLDDQLLRERNIDEVSQAQLERERAERERQHERAQPVGA